MSQIHAGTQVYLSISCLSRLTLGLMGLDELHLRVLATSSDNLLEKENAKKGVLYFGPVTTGTHVLLKY